MDIVSKTSKTGVFDVFDSCFRKSKIEVLDNFVEMSITVKMENVYGYV